MTDAIDKINMIFDEVQCIPEKNKNFQSPEDIVIKLKKLIKKIEQSHHHFKNPLVSRSQARIIFPIIKNQNGHSIQELSNITSVDKALVSRTIADLEKKGIVQRDKEVTSNERNYKIILAPKGQELLLEHAKKVKEFSLEWFNNVTKEELFTFHDILCRLTEK